MADSTGDELDRRIRKLTGAAGDEGPTVMTSLPASTFQGATSHLFERRRWLAMAVVGLLIVGVGALAFGNHNPMRSATPITGTSESAVTTAFTEASASEVPTTPVVTTAPDPITRPFMGPPICASGSAREFLSRGITYRPFALDYQGTMLLQVLAATTDGVAKPFAVVLRAPASNRAIANAHQVTINGANVSIAIHTNGNGEALWTLPDGSKAYLRSRDLDEGAVEALIGRLTPRDIGAHPGFDLTPTIDPDGLVLLHEHLNTPTCPARSPCSSAATEPTTPPRFPARRLAIGCEPSAATRCTCTSGSSTYHAPTRSESTAPARSPSRAPPAQPLRHSNKSRTPTLTTLTQLLTTEASFDTVVTADRTCTGGDLQATADPTTEAAMGHVLYVNRLTNIRDTACNLAGATRQRPRRTPQDERLQRQTRRPPHLAHPHTPDRRRHPHPQPTLSYWYCR